MQNQAIAVPYTDTGLDTVSHFIDTEYGYKHGFRWAAVGINVAFIILLRFVVALATKFLHFQKR
jgi:ABC-type multidrug transport system permease subunit